MKELIKITEKDGEQIVSARELHQFLGSKQQFSDWIKDRIKKYGFVNGQDFEVFHKIMNNPEGGRPQIEYTLTLDMAKELSMVEGNKKGKQARQYFISCERMLKDILQNQLCQAQESAQKRFLKSGRIREIDVTISSLLKERKELVREINCIDRMDFRQLNFQFNNSDEPFSLGFPSSKYSRLS